ncbi:MAG: energy-coupling factor transporter transmembrane protein EcfT, partial [Synergistaceae bacterium]|nr:energy-coupling factor transporter transmembrane protein EcfT [Synergistaceae bacterium]
SLGFSALALLGTAKLSHIPAGTLLRSCRPVLFLALFTFLFNLFAGWGGGDFASFLHALGAAVLAVSRLLLLVFFAVMLPLTTAPLELADGMESLLSPLGRFGFPAHECAMMTGVALRFIPLLTEEADRIVKAQVSRGARLDQGNPVRRVIAFFPVLIPLFVIIFRRAEELALAMEARGYQGGKGRTRRSPLVWKKSDTGATIFVMLTITALVLFRAFVVPFIVQGAIL